MRTCGFHARALNTLFAGLLLLPMTLAIGMTYPLAVRVLASDADDAAPASARVYAWNTVGAIVGSLAAGFVLIPALQVRRRDPRRRVRQRRARHRRVVGAAARESHLAIAATRAGESPAACFFRPQAPMKLLVTSPLNVGTNGRVLYYDIGRSASVVMLAQDGGLALRTNGLPEALMDSPGSLPRFSGEYWLSPLAVIARPRGARHADRRIRRRRRDRRRSAERAPHRRHRARAQGHRGEPQHRARCASAIRSPIRASTSSSTTRAARCGSPTAATTPSCRSPPIRGPPAPRTSTRASSCSSRTIT